MDLNIETVPACLNLAPRGFIPGCTHISDITAQPEASFTIYVQSKDGWFKYFKETFQIKLMGFTSV